MLIEINFGILNLLECQVVLIPKCLRSAYLNKGPGEAAEVFTNTALRKYWFILSANRWPSPAASKSALSSYSSPDTRGAARHPKDGGSSYPRRYAWGTDGGQRSPPLVYTSSCRLMLDLSTREWRTLRTLWTFQILGLERRKSISSSDFLAVLQRYWLNDWNCWGRRERCGRGVKPKGTAQAHSAAAVTSATAICALTTGSLKAVFD